MSASHHPLRDWRKKQGPFEDRKGSIVSQGKLAGDVGVVASHLSQIETGDRQPSLDVAVKLSDITGIPVVQFVKTRERAS